MVKRKYIKLILLISCVISIFPHIIYASAYLPEPETYKYTTSVSTIDKISRKMRKQKMELFEKIQDAVYSLGIIRDTIAKRASDEKRALYNSESRDIISINYEIEKLEKEAKILDSFSDDTMSYLEVEYGADENKSFGTKLAYNTSRFSTIDNKKTYRNTNDTKNIDVFFKYKIWQNNRYIVTARPNLHYSIYNNRYNSHILDLGIFVGRSKKKKKNTNFQEIGFSLIKHWGKWAPKDLGYKISLTEGLKFNNSVMISNYTEYKKIRSKNYLYSDTVYDQISIAKDFYFGSLYNQKFTAQIGYFWKGARTNKLYIISGPIFSAWLDL